jgi:hypothetical protein
MMILIFPVSCWALAGIIMPKLKRERNSKMAEAVFHPACELDPGWNFKQLFCMVQSLNGLNAAMSSKSS